MQPLSPLGPGTSPGGGVCPSDHRPQETLCPFPGRCCVDYAKVPRSSDPGLRNFQESQAGPSLSSSPPCQVSSAPSSWLAPDSVVSCQREKASETLSESCRSRTQARRPSRPCPDIAPARHHHPTLAPYPPTRILHRVGIWLLLPGPRRGAPARLLDNLQFTSMLSRESTVSRPRPHPTPWRQP